MRDYQLYTEIIAVIQAALNEDENIPNVVVKQAFQPTQQGAPTGPAVLLNKIPGDVRFGSPKKEDRWDPAANGGQGAMIHTEVQWYESTFQVNALVTQDPADLTPLTASDLLNAVSAILQSDATIVYLRTKGIGILRVRDIRNPTFIDDRDRNEYSPSFDFTLTHEQAIISTSPATDTVEYGIYRI